ncbi:MAG: hypothetical protein JOY71_26730 [Acetobacteraceae bacterium]|nr:hypothetical protein [Acetobacteraceae bacterium]
MMALGRKSWLFAGSDRGGERAAARYTLIGTARLTLAEIKREGYVLKAEEFPPSFQTSLEDYITFLADPPKRIKRRLRAFAEAPSPFGNSSSANGLCSCAP